VKEENGIKAGDPGGIEKEVTLLDYLIVILKHKWLVISCVLIALFIAVSYISYTNFKSSKFSAPPAPAIPSIFRSICIVTPVDLDANGIIAILKKFELSQLIIQKNNLLPLLFAGMGDEENNGGLSEKTSNSHDGYNQLQGSLAIKPINPANEIELSYEDRNPERAQKILNYIVEGAKEYSEQQFQRKKKKTLENLNLQIKYLTQQVAGTSDPAVKKAIADRLAGFMIEEFLERNREYQGFKIIFLSSNAEIKLPPKPTIETKQAEPPKPKMNPGSQTKPMIFISFLVFLALIIGVFSSFFLEYMKILKKRYPEKIKDLSFWSKLRK
jgi:hypothetical protein